MSEPAAPDRRPGRSPRPEGPSPGSVSFYDARRRPRSSRSRPPFLAFLVGGLVVAVTGAHIPFRPTRRSSKALGSTGSSRVTGDTHGGGAGSAADALIMTPLILTGARGRVRLPLRHVQHRRPGPVLGRAHRRDLRRHALRRRAAGRHVTLAIVAAIAAGAVWGGIAGLLKATVGAHEVISTIMLNWIAIWVGKWLLERPAASCREPNRAMPRSDNILDSAKLPAIWGSPPAAARRHLHRSLRPRRLPLPPEPDDARLRGARRRLQPGGRRATAGSLWQELLPRARDRRRLRRARRRDRHARLEVPRRRARFRRELHGFIGIAVALLGRNKAVGILFAALLFAALKVGTSPRQLDPEVFNPELATNLATIIQALIILFVGAELLIVYLWRARGGSASGQRAPSRRPLR